jgi:hypothetical protein
MQYNSKRNDRKQRRLKVFKMDRNYAHLSLVIWILLATPVLFAESYPDRPTAFQMRWLVKTGTECVMGVNERCAAAQNQVAQFTNNGCWYLDNTFALTTISRHQNLEITG